MFDGDLVHERARITPQRIALVDIETGQRLTYAELDARIDRAAATLEPNSTFGILAHNCIEFLELFFAAGRVNAIVVPLSTRATEHERDAIIRDCGMNVLYDGLGVRWQSHRFGSSGNRQPATGNPEDTYCLLYTSGTTGKPKGVMIPRRQLWWNGYNTAINWGLRETDVSPVFTPLYHAGGLAAFLIPIFSAGGTIVLHKTFDPSIVWQTIERERCTVILGVPTIWKMLMDAPEFATVDLAHVRWLISGGAPLPLSILDAYRKRGVVMRQGYGMTEAGVNCFTMTDEDALRKPGSIGKPMMFTEAKLIEVQDGVGELCLRGPHVSKGYWNNEEATRAAYDAGGFFHTGDLARCDDDGFYFIAGRRKEMFITGGVNVYPAEIEAALAAHPSVADAAVIAVEDETWGEAGVAFVVAHDITSDELAAFLATKIAKYKVPRRFVFLEALPRTPYGKVVKDELRKAINVSP
ncbi:MAG TPA: AMP-binding protein [Thermoanaerobaculia bacterium]|nr:AMP-binding protein [Thermoanaerobaculia bacterium]